MGFVPKDRPEDPEGTALREVMGLIWFLSDLRPLGLALMKEPILVDSGQWEPIYDRPRSYADVEGEVSSALVNLPKFRVKAKLLAGNSVLEHMLQVPVRGMGSALVRSGPVETIRAKTQREYCDALDDVLDRISRRSHSSALADEAHSQRRVRVTQPGSTERPCQVG